MTTTNDSGFGLVVRFTVKPGSEAAFDDLVETTIAEIRRREPGTVLYISHQVAGAPRERIFYELYLDRTAFDAHEAQPHVQRFLAGREPLLDATEVDFLTPVIHAGIAGER